MLVPSTRGIVAQLRLLTTLLLDAFVASFLSAGLIGCDVTHTLAITHTHFASCSSSRMHTYATSLNQWRGLKVGSTIWDYCRFTGTSSFMTVFHYFSAGQNEWCGDLAISGFVSFHFLSFRFRHCLSFRFGFHFALFALSLARLSAH